MNEEGLTIGKEYVVNDWHINAPIGLTCILKRKTIHGQYELMLEKEVDFGNENMSRFMYIESADFGFLGENFLEETNTPFNKIIEEHNV